MDEQLLNTIEASKLLWVAIFAFVYGKGGVYNKTWRRIVGPLIVMTGICFYSIVFFKFSWLFILYPFLLYGALSLGYGSDTLKEKVLLRARYGVSIGISALPLAVVTGQWGMFIFHIILSLFVSIFYGVLNPTSARAEEVIIAGFAVYIPMFMIS